VHCIEVVVVNEDLTQLRASAHRIKWQNAIDGIVRQVQHPQLGEGAPYRRWQGACEIVGTQEQPSQLAQASEAFWDGAIQVLLVLPDLRHTEVARIVWTWRTCDSLPWPEALSIGLIGSCQAHTGITDTPAQQGALLAIGII